MLEQKEWLLTDMLPACLPEPVREAGTVVFSARWLFQVDFVLQSHASQGSSVGFLSEPRVHLLTVYHHLKTVFFAFFVFSSEEEQVEKKVRWRELCTWFS